MTRQDPPVTGARRDELPYAAVDPGRSKCGLVRSDGAAERILEAGVLDPEQCWAVLQRWQQLGLIASLVLGDGTGSGFWRQRCRQQQLPVLLVQEAGSTLAARRRFWELEPPRGWQRLLPQGLRLPPRDIDDVVAQLLLERHLGRRLGRDGSTWLERDQKRARTVKA